MVKKRKRQKIKSQTNVKSRQVQRQQIGPVVRVNKQRQQATCLGHDYVFAWLTACRLADGFPVRRLPWQTQQIFVYVFCLSQCAHVVDNDCDMCSADQPRNTLQRLSNCRTID